MLLFTGTVNQSFFFPSNYFMETNENANLVITEKSHLYMYQKN